MTAEAVNDQSPLQSWLTAHLDRLQQRHELLHRTAEHLDKTLITLSSGALVLSMTFVRSVAPTTQLLRLLFASWAAFVASILCVLFAMAFAQAAGAQITKQFAKQLEQTLAQILSGTLDQTKPKRLKLVTSKLGKTITVLNIAAMAAFVIGVTLLGIFVGYNIWLEHASRSILLALFAGRCSFSRGGDFSQT